MQLNRSAAFLESIKAHALEEAARDGIVEGGLGARRRALRVFVREKSLHDAPGGLLVAADDVRDCAAFAQRRHAFLQTLARCGSRLFKNVLVVAQMHRGQLVQAGTGGQEPHGIAGAAPVIGLAGERKRIRTQNSLGGIGQRIGHETARENGAGVEQWQIGLRIAPAKKLRQPQPARLADAKRKQRRRRAVRPARHNQHRRDVMSHANSFRPRAHPALGLENGRGRNRLQLAPCLHDGLELGEDFDFRTIAHGVSLFGVLF